MSSALNDEEHASLVLNREGLSSLYLTRNSGGNIYLNISNCWLFLSYLKHGNLAFINWFVDVVFLYIIGIVFNILDTISVKGIYVNHNGLKLPKIAVFDKI